MMKIKYKDQILLEYAYSTVNEVYLNKQLFKPGSDMGLEGIERDLNRDASRIGKEVADIKGNHHFFSRCMFESRHFWFRWIQCG